MGGFGGSGFRGCGVRVERSGLGSKLSELAVRIVSAGRRLLRHLMGHAENVLGLGIRHKFRRA